MSETHKWLCEGCGKRGETTTEESDPYRPQAYVEAHHRQIAAGCNATPAIEEIAPTDEPSLRFAIRLDSVGKLPTPKEWASLYEHIAAYNEVPAEGKDTIQTFTAGKNTIMEVAVFPLDEVMVEDRDETQGVGVATPVEAELATGIAAHLANVFTDRISAGELRTFGADVPADIPDCATILRSALSFDGPSVTEDIDDPDVLKVRLEGRSSEPFAWHEMNFTIDGDSVRVADAPTDSVRGKALVGCVLDEANFASREAAPKKNTNEPITVMIEATFEYSDPTIETPAYNDLLHLGRELAVARATLMGGGDLHIEQERQPGSKDNVKITIDAYQRRPGDYTRKVQKAIRAFIRRIVRYPHKPATDRGLTVMPRIDGVIEISIAETQINFSTRNGVLEYIEAFGDSGIGPRWVFERDDATTAGILDELGREEIAAALSVITEKEIKG